MTKSIWNTINLNCPCTNLQILLLLLGLSTFGRIKDGITKFFIIHQKKFITIAWAIWQHRNKIIFDKQVCNQACILDMATIMFSFTTLYRSNTKNIHRYNYWLLVQELGEMGINPRATPHQGINRIRMLLDGTLNDPRRLALCARITLEG